MDYKEKLENMITDLESKQYDVLKDINLQNQMLVRITDVMDNLNLDLESAKVCDDRKINHIISMDLRSRAKEYHNINNFIELTVSVLL